MLLCLVHLKDLPKYFFKALEVVTVGVRCHFCYELLNYVPQNCKTVDLWYLLGEVVGNLNDNSFSGNNA